MTIGLPDESGYTLIRQIRELSAAKGGQVPAIALMSNAQESDRKQAFEAGFQQHLSKPVGIDTLLQAVWELASSKFQYLS